ncbi:MAG: GMC family oxidoreductase N-terminal domain-containing protein [Bacteroidia bacterium]|nr:GMC family oxidoreductase N-terminal domain-containing protein [Bacteroidia bacterium]
MKENNIYDYIIIGSGFGGSVSAMRLSEKGYRCLVLEKGRAYKTEDMPASDWDIKKYVWKPALRLFGMMNLSFFREVLVVSGTGVGGGSLIYANTHLVPPDTFFQNPVWKHLNDWKKELMPYYEKAKFMLGTTAYPRLDPEDKLLKAVAEDMGRGHTFHPVNVGVYYGDTKVPKDPYFNGLGPLRTGCIDCAGCMTGCRYNAKNTLDKNYLFFARQNGTEVLPERLVTKIEYKEGIYRIHTEKTTGFFWNRQKKVFESRGLVVSGGVLGTMELLLGQKYQSGTLPLLSDTLGANIRTNSESITGMVFSSEKLNHGASISSGFNPDEHTKVEVVKYNNASGLIAKLASFSTDGHNSFSRAVQLIRKIVLNPIRFLKIATQKEWGKASMMMLVMQNLDNALKMEWKKNLFGGKIRFAKEGVTVPVYIPVGQEVLYRYAEKVNATPLNSIVESLFNLSTTAHILGGCTMGESAETGVIDKNFQVFNYPNMYVLDGSVIQGNLGVNPSLTITALSEYAMARIPEKEGNTIVSLDSRLGG